MPKSSYTRPGVAAAVRLANLQTTTNKNSTNTTTTTTKKRVEIWNNIESKYQSMLLQKGGQKLVDLDNYCSTLSRKLQSSSSSKPCCSSSITKEELLKTIEWKFTKGKPRYALMNHLKSNSESSVELYSSRAFEMALRDNDDVVKNAINAFCELKGVGPATASAFLGMYLPNKFAFMDDEVIECLYEGKRGYTLKIYLDVNEKCRELAESLNGELRKDEQKEEEEEWSAYRVGRALWTAARIAACGGDLEDDLTLMKNGDDSVSATTTTTTTKASSSSAENKKKKRLTKEETSDISGTTSTTSSKASSSETKKKRKMIKETTDTNDQDETRKTRGTRKMPSRNAKKQKK